MIMQVLLCVSLAVVVFNDLLGALQIRVAGFKPSFGGVNVLLDMCSTLLSMALRGSQSAGEEAKADRLERCARSVVVLRLLREELKDNHALVVDTLVEASALASLLHPDDDPEHRRALFQTVESALQALDVHDRRARSAAEALLEVLHAGQGVLPDWQLWRLQDGFDTELELLAVMSSAKKADYERSRFVRAERAGDHRLADLGSLLNAEYDNMHEAEYLCG